MAISTNMARIALAGVLAASIALAGCSSAANNAATEQQQANRAYMSQVNEAMTKLDSNLDSFIDAVSRGDVVNMRTQADNAYKAIDKLSELEAPEALADIKKDYVDGTAKLREALDEYISLYAKATSEGSDFDWSAYDDRIKEIQSLYDEGVALLEAGDKAAAEAK